MSPAAPSSEEREPTATPIGFVVGHPRSGTTVLGRFLAAHRDIAYWEEPKLLVHAMRWRREFHRLTTHLEADLSVDIFDSDRGRSLRTQVRANPDLEKSLAMADRLLVTVLRQVADEAVSIGGAKMLVEKTPEEVPHVEVGLTLLPEGRAIHIVRDPRAVLASTLGWIQGRSFTKGQPIDIEATGWPPWLERTSDVPGTIAERWVEVLRTGASLEVKHPDRVLTIRYEDLMGEARVTAGTVIDFLDLPWDSRLTRFLEDEQLGFETGPVERWKELLTDEQVIRVQDVAGHEMRRMGYP